jgi:hypothetical protein
VSSAALVATMASATIATSVVHRIIYGRYNTNEIHYT